MPQVRTVTLPVASFPSGTEASGGLGTSSKRALSRTSIGATFCSSALTSSRMRRSSSIAASSRLFAIAADRRFCSAFSCSSFVIASRRSASRRRISSTGAGSPFLRAPSLTRSGCSRMKLRLSMASTEAGEQDDVTDRGLVRENRDQPVDPQAHAAGRGKTVFEGGQEVLIHRMCFLIAGCASPGLVFEPASLVIGIVELREGIGDLLSGEEELEAVGQPRVAGSPASERRDFDRVSEHERRLDQRVLNQLLEQLGDEPAPTQPGLGLDVVFLDQGLERGLVGLAHVLTDGCADRLHHLHPLEGPRERDLLALVLDRRRTLHPLHEVNHQRLGQLHHALDVGIGLVELEHRVLGAVPLVHALVAEDAADLEDAVVATDDEPFQIELERDAQIKVHVERVVVSSEGSRGGPAGQRLKDGRFHLNETATLEEGTRLFHHAAPDQENVHHLGIRDQIQIALPIAELLVLQSVVLLRKGSERLGEQDEFVDLTGDLATLGPKKGAVDADDIAQVEIGKALVWLLPQLVDLRQQLDASGVVLD